MHYITLWMYKLWKVSARLEEKAKGHKNKMNYKLVAFPQQ